MDAVYQKLYVYLVGEIDDVLQTIAENLVDGNTGWHELNTIGERLKNALLTAEECYLDGAGE